MAFPHHQYSVAECGRKQKLRGPGGEGAICEFCETAFASTKECNRHVELDKQCRRAKRHLRRKVRERVQQMKVKERVKQMATSADDDSGISVEEEEEKSRLQPLRIKINLAKKKVHAPSSHKTENGKEGRSGRSSVQLETKDVERFAERVAPTMERLENRIQTRPIQTQASSLTKADSTPMAMVRIKEEILQDLTIIKSEPVEDRSHAATGIRVALEKTKGRKYSVAFTSSLPPSQEAFEQSSTVGDKVSKKDTDSPHKTGPNTDEPASKQTKKKSEKESNFEAGKSSCEQKKRSKDSLGCDSKKSEVFHLAEGTFKPVLPDHLKGVWVAFDSTFLANLNTVFCFKLTTNGQVKN